MLCCIQGPVVNFMFAIVLFVWSLWCHVHQQTGPKGSMSVRARQNVTDKSETSVMTFTVTDLLDNGQVAARCGIYVLKKHNVSSCVSNVNN